MNKFLWILGLAMLVLGITFAMGPSPARPSLQISMPTVSNDLIEYGMTPETFSKEKQDEVVFVAAMQEMFQQVATPTDLKREIAFPSVGNHILASNLKSEDLETVRKATTAFAEDFLKLKPVQ